MRAFDRLFARWTRLRRDRRGAVALIVALALPALFSAAAVALEVGGWSVVKLELQRRADVAAFAAALRYTAGTTAQAAATAAADVAALNGAAAASRSWSSASNMLTSSDVTVLYVSGIKNNGDPAFKVVVTQPMALTFGRLYTAATSVTVSATAYGEVVSIPGGGPQPCILALSGGVSADISVAGTALINASNCSIRSNASITITGTPMITATGIYASGSITGNVPNVPLYPNSGTIPDPYANNTALNDAFSQLGTSSQQLKTDGTVNSPGSYSGLSVGNKGTVNLAPGTYYINGDISLSGGTINGSGVTIISSGNLSTTGGTFQVSAPLATSTSGGIPGIAYASKSSGSSNINGNSTTPINGVIYYPNGTITFNGTSDTSANGCLEVIAGTVKINGDTSLAANCSSYGAKSFGSLPSTSTAALVQ